MQLFSYLNATRTVIDSYIFKEASFPSRWKLTLKEYRTLVKKENGFCFSVQQEVILFVDNSKCHQSMSRLLYFSNVQRLYEIILYPYEMMNIFNTKARHFEQKIETSNVNSLKACKLESLLDLTHTKTI